MENSVLIEVTQAQLIDVINQSVQNQSACLFPSFITFCSKYVTYTTGLSYAEPDNLSLLKSSLEDDFNVR